MKKLAIAIFPGLLFIQSAHAFSFKDYLHGVYLGYIHSNIDYRLSSNGAPGHPKTSNSSTQIAIGKRINEWASVEVDMLYSTSTDDFNNDSNRAILGRQFAMEVNNNYSLNFRAIAFQYKELYLYGVLGWTRLKYLDDAGDYAHGQGFNYGMGMAWQPNKRVSLSLAVEKLPRSDYDENIWGPSLDPMHIEATQLKLQFDLTLKE